MAPNTLLSSIEVPSGKDKSYENFPVGSWLLPSHLRPDINTFYKFARAIDDIADTNLIEAREKLKRLSEFENVILGKDTTSQGYEKAHLMRQSLQDTGVTHQHCVKLIKAFKQDTTKLRYRNWEELIDYCKMSAAPVGRYLLDLHGESVKLYAASDALCIALQVLNHLQDCKDDYVTLNRVYLPQDWMSRYGLKVDCLDNPSSIPEFNSLKFQILDATNELITLAKKLPNRLNNKRLAMETGAILNIAIALERKLRKSDPLVETVKLSKSQFAYGCISGVLRTLLTH